MAIRLKFSIAVRLSVGVNGHPGKDGKPGKDGTPGAKGQAGPPGAPGEEGAVGKDGSNGKNGRDGQPGVLPSPRRHGMSSALECCRATPCTHGARGRTHRNRVGFGCMPVYSHGHGSLRCVGVARVHIRGCGTQLKLLHRSQGSMCRRASLAPSRLNAAACCKCAG